MEQDGIENIVYKALDKVLKICYKYIGKKKRIEESRNEKRRND